MRVTSPLSNDCGPWRYAAERVDFDILLRNLGLFIGSKCVLTVKKWVNSRIRMVERGVSLWYTMGSAHGVRLRDFIYTQRG